MAFYRLFHILPVSWSVYEATGAKYENSKPRVPCYMPSDVLPGTVAINFCYRILMSSRMHFAERIDDLLRADIC